MTEQQEAAMRQALEALKGIRQYGLDTLSGRIDGPDDREWQRAAVNEMAKRARLGITALTAALADHALDKMAENAREIGLEYEPSAGTQVSKVWWDGEKLVAQPIPLENFYKAPEQPAQQECQHEWLRGECVRCGRSMEQRQYQDTADKCKLETVPAKGGLLPAQQEPVECMCGICKLGKREPLTDEQCDAIYTALDKWAHEVDSYDFGLPLIAGGGAIKGREIIRAALGIKGDA